MELPVELLNRYEASSELKPDDITRKLASFKTDPAIQLDGTVHFERRRKMLATVAAENFQDAFERYNGENNLLPVNYLQMGFFKSRSVGRIQFVDTEIRKPVVATGFLISNDLVMTNHHVFPDPAAFRDAQIEFDYEYDINGREKTRIIFDLNADRFFHSNKSLDFTIIGINQKDKTGSVDIRDRGFLVLNGNIGKAGLGDYASIIQHAEGRPMQIALRENRIIENAITDMLTYKADTSQGSSGSPVFNDEWQLIALHSAGVAQKNAEGKFIDKDGQVIPEINGKVDSTRLVWISNQGPKISAIMNYLQQLANPDPLVLFLFTPSYTDDKQLSYLSLPADATNTGGTGKNILTKESANGAPGFPDLYININFGDKTSGIHPGISVQQPAVGQAPGFEKKLEDEIDYNNCKGFDEFFLAVHTPIPAVSLKLKKQLAFYTDNPNLYILKYHHYSSIQHAVRKMPVMSAINVTNTNRFRLPILVENWFRDRRINLDLQLNDEFYRKSGFDKGHMSRREDAEWGDDIRLAETAANMTYAYTNACPQVPDLNRAVFGFNGKWGALEIELLEKAVMHEPGGSKIVVYNGPVFSDDDPVFKGIQIPMKFWKIVVWRNAVSKLKTTCFLLTQEKLVNDIAFEELRIDEIFKTAQCSVKQIEKLTKLSFTKIRTWDSFIPPAAGVDEVAITPASFEKFILENKDDADDVQAFS